MTENRDFFASPGQQQGKVLPKPIKMWFGFNGRWFDRYFPRIISEVGFIFWKLSCENNYCVVELIPWLEGTNTKHTRSWEIWELSDKRLFADYIYCSSLRLPRTKKQNNKHFNFNLIWHGQSGHQYCYFWTVIIRCPAFSGLILAPQFCLSEEFANIVLLCGSWIMASWHHISTKQRSDE